MAARLASPLLKVHPSVASALASKRPVVALESTIITHGLPYPANLQTALAIEQAVRDQGAVPATTAFLDGVAYVGLDKNQVERLADVGLTATKTSRRDIASVLAAGRGSVGATTVSGTMILAHMAGIPIFGTGGIGGVHRGGQDSLDVSADLTELSRTPVAVFCSGAKSILDIPRTLEYLETFGVSTHTFHSSGQFPAFYSARSGCKVPFVSTHRDAARLIYSNSLFGMQSGMVFGVPIPPEFESAGEEIQKMVEQAVRESIEQGVDRRGKEVTPWLLKRVGELSEGRSITSNKALVINNVTSAAKVARELEDIKASEALIKADEESKIYSGTGFEAIGEDEEGRQHQQQAKRGKRPPPLFIVGFTAVDITSQPTLTDALIGKDQQHSSSTWPGRNALSLGGVARNMAESAHRISSGMQRNFGSTQLISPVADDVLGMYIKAGLMNLDMPTDGLVSSLGRSASVTLQLDSHGDLITGIADIDEAQMTPDQVDEIMSEYKGQEKVVAVDGNISVRLLANLLRPEKNNIVIVEPTSIAKCTKIIDAMSSPDIVTPNEVEVLAMYRYAVQKGLLSPSPPSNTSQEKDRVEQAEALLTSVEVLHASKEMSRLLNSVLLIKGGVRGVLLVRPIEGSSNNSSSNQEGRDESAITLRHPAHAVDPLSIGNTTGCGDTFAGAIAFCTHALLHQADVRPKEYSNDIWSAVIDIAQRAASLSLQSEKATSPALHTLCPSVERLCE